MTPDEEGTALILVAFVGDRDLVFSEVLELLLKHGVDPPADFGVKQMFIRHRAQGAPVECPESPVGLPPAIL